MSVFYSRCKALEFHSCGAQFEDRLSVYSISSSSPRLIRTISLPHIVFTESHSVLISTHASGSEGPGLESLFGDRLCWLTISEPFQESSGQ
jgi:hypothetical protein